MSVKQNATVTCPSCHVKSHFTMWSSVNTTDDPDMKEKLLDGSLFFYTCPHCNKKILLDYSVLYHQEDSKFMVYYASDDKIYSTMSRQMSCEGGKEEAQHYQNLYEEGYILRVVRSKNAMIEKIQLFDAGYDDRIIEIMKVLLSGKILQDDPKTDFDGMDFYRDKKGADLLLLTKSGCAFASMNFDKNYYQYLSGQYMKDIYEKTEKVVNIDMSWAVRFLENESKK